MPLDLAGSDSLLRLDLRRVVDELVSGPSRPRLNGQHHGLLFDVVGHGRPPDLFTAAVNQTGAFSSR